MEELLLSLLFAGNELDVVEEKDVDVPERLPEKVEVLGLKTINKLVSELFGSEVNGSNITVNFNGLVYLSK